MEEEPTSRSGPHSPAFQRAMSAEEPPHDALGPNPGPHPAFRKAMIKHFAGKEVTDRSVPGGHFHALAGDLTRGDGIHHEGQSWVVKDLREHERGITAVVEPRRGFVGRTVMSQMQFGTPGITLEDTSERAFTFQSHDLIHLRG